MTQDEFAGSRLVLDRSGFIFGSDGGGSEWDLVVIPVLWVINWAANLLIFRGG